MAYILLSMLQDMQIKLQLINRLNDISVPMVNDPGEAMKKTQVIKGISNEFAAFAQIEATRDMAWAEYNTSIKDQVTHFADILLC